MHAAVLSLQHQLRVVRRPEPQPSTPQSGTNLTELCDWAGALRAEVKQMKEDRCLQTSPSTAGF